MSDSLRIKLDTDGSLVSSSYRLQRQTCYWTLKKVGLSLCQYGGSCYCSWELTEAGLEVTMTGENNLVFNGQL